MRSADPYKGQQEEPEIVNGNVTLDFNVKVVLTWPTAMRYVQAQALRKGSSMRPHLAAAIERALHDPLAGLNPAALGLDPTAITITTIT